MEKKGCAVVLLGIVLLVGAEEPPDIQDPLSGLFVRQEVTLRKLDGLTAKVGRVDVLEAKLDHVTGILQGMEERNALLEARLTEVEARVTSEMSDLKEGMKGQLIQTETKLIEVFGEVDKKVEKIDEVFETVDEKVNKVEVDLGRVSEKVDKIDGVIEGVDGKVEEVGEVLEAVLERFGGVTEQLNSKTDQLGQVVTQLSEKINQLGVLESKLKICENQSDCNLKFDIDFEELLENYHLNMSQSLEVMFGGLREDLVEVLETEVNETRRYDGCEESMARLKTYLGPGINQTHLMLNTVIKTIRISNLAMDKRLEALLHTSSLRQRVLRDSLLKAISALGGQIQAQSQAVYRKIEARVGGLEETLSSAVKLHTKNLAGQMLETANLTLATLASRFSHTLDNLKNTSSDLYITLENLQNTSTDLHFTLDNLGPAFKLDQNASSDLQLVLANLNLASNLENLQNTSNFDLLSLLTLQETSDLNLVNLTLASLTSKLAMTLDGLQNTSKDLQLSVENLKAEPPPTSPVLCLLQDEDAGSGALQDNENSTLTTTNINGTEFYQYSDSSNTYDINSHSQTLEETMKRMQEVMEGKLSEVEDRLSGLRIYLSTSLHMHAQQVEDRMSSVESGVEESVRQMLAKSSRTMDKLRRSSLGYLDAAVTSISSAAVASAQATADQLKDALRDVTRSLNDRLDQVEASVRSASHVCPPPYQSVGGVCVVVLPGPPSPWHQGRERCQQVGADLATLPLPSLPLSNIPPAWIGGRLVNGQWKWLTGGIIEGVTGGIIEGVTGEGECLSVGTGGSPVPYPCHNPLPVLCQQRHPSSSSQLPNIPFNTYSNEVNPPSLQITSNNLLYLPMQDDPNNI